MSKSELSKSQSKGCKCSQREVSSSREKKVKVRVPAAWHSLKEQCREGSRTMQVIHRQTGDKEENRTAEKKREQ